MIPVIRKPGVLVYSSEHFSVLFYRDLDTAIRAQPYHNFSLSAGGSLVIVDPVNSYPGFLGAGRDYEAFHFAYRPSPHYFNFYYEDGTHIDPVIVIERAAELSLAWSNRLPRWARKKDFVFRVGSVKGLHKRRSRKRSCYRYPRTRQEAKYFEAHDSELREYGSFLRRRRAKLPTVWDDIVSGDYRNRNWKHQRKTQWKPKRQDD